MSARAADRDLLHPRAARAQQDGALIFAVHVDRRVDPAQRALVLEAIDRHRRRVRHFFAQQTEDLLPHELGGEKALVAIGDLVRAR